jgi:amidase
MKPTVGLISRSGVIPVALSMDSVGPMTRSVKDAAHLLNALAGPDPEDAATLSRPAAIDYVAALAPDLRDIRVGVVREPAASARTQALFESALADLRKVGASVIDPVSLPDLTESWLTDHMEVMLTELKAHLGEYLALRRPQAPVRTVAEILAANARDGIRQPPMEEAAQKGPLSGERYRSAFETIRGLAREDGIDRALTEHRLHVLVSPSIGPAWRFEDEARETFLPRALVMTSDAGYPCITVPMGDVDGLPVGVMFFAGAWSEAMLLRCAFAFEQATHHRRPPPV